MLPKASNVIAYEMHPPPPHLSKIWQEESFRRHPLFIYFGYSLPFLQRSKMNCTIKMLQKEQDKIYNSE